MLWTCVAGLRSRPPSLAGQVVGGRTVEMAQDHLDSWPDRLTPGKLRRQTGEVPFPLSRRISLVRFVLPATDTSNRQVWTARIAMWTWC